MKECHAINTGQMILYSLVPQVGYLPVSSENYNLTEREFFDDVTLRYRWKIKRLPFKCACGKSFNVDDAMSCLKDSFIQMRHDVIRDLLAKRLREICNETVLSPLSNLFAMMSQLRTSIITFIK